MLSMARLPTPSRDKSSKLEEKASQIASRFPSLPPQHECRREISIIGYSHASRKDVSSCDNACERWDNTTCERKCERVFFCHCFVRFRSLWKSLVKFGCTSWHQRINSKKACVSLQSRNLRLYWVEIQTLFSSILILLYIIGIGF